MINITSEENFVNIFNELRDINVSENISVKPNNSRDKALNYLSWAWAWAYLCSRYDASFKIKRFEQDRMYSYDPLVGYFVETSMTINGKTLDCWLPVLDHRNNPMFDHATEIVTKKFTMQVAAATSVDINKTIMRCLVKNIALFGLGLYLYTGDDLPPDYLELKDAVKKAVKDRYVQNPERTKNIISRVVGSKRIEDISDSQTLRDILILFNTEWEIKDE